MREYGMSDCMQNTCFVSKLAMFLTGTANGWSRNPVVWVMSHPKCTCCWWGITPRPHNIATFPAYTVQSHSQPILYSHILSLYCTVTFPAYTAQSHSQSMLYSHIPSLCCTVTFPVYTVHVRLASNTKPCLYVYEHQSCMNAYNSFIKEGIVCIHTIFDN